MGEAVACRTASTLPSPSPLSPSAAPGSRPHASCSPSPADAAPRPAQSTSRCSPAVTTARPRSHLDGANHNPWVGVSHWHAAGKGQLEISLTDSSLVIRQKLFARKLGGGFRRSHYARFSKLHFASIDASNWLFGSLNFHTFKRGEPSKEKRVLVRTKLWHAVPHYNSWCCF